MVAPVRMVDKTIPRTVAGRPDPTAAAPLGSGGVALASPPPGSADRAIRSVAR